MKVKPLRMRVAFGHDLDRAHAYSHPHWFIRLYVLAERFNHEATTMVKTYFFAN